MRKLWILVFMDFKGIARKISYYFIMSAVVGAIFYSISMYMSQGMYNFETFQGSCYKWLLLMTALVSAYYGVVRTAKVRKIGIVEELLAIPVKKYHLILSIFISRVLVVWIPIFSAYLIVGLWTDLITPGFLSIVAVGFSLLLFVSFFVSIGYFVSLMFARAFIPLVINFTFILVFWHLATIFPYWGNNYLHIQQVLYKYSVGFNPFTFMYALGLSNFLVGTFIFIFLFVVLMVLVSASAFKHSGWVPGDVQARFRVKIGIAIRNILTVIVFFLVFAGIMSWYIGFYSLDFSEDQKATPREALHENLPEISVQFSDIDADLLRFSIFFDKLARTSDKRIVWTPTAASGWSGAVLVNEDEDKICVEMGYLKGTDNDINAVALKIDKLGVAKNIQKIQSTSGVNQIADFESAAISFACRQDNRNRVFAVGRNFTDSVEFQNIVEEETFEIIIPPSIDYISEHIDFSKDLLLIAPKSDDEFNAKSMERLFSMIKGGVAAFILLPEVRTQNDISQLFKHKLTDPLCTNLEDYFLETYVGRYKYSDLDSFITDNNNVCCNTNYLVYAPWNSFDSKMTKINAPVEFYSLKSINKDWQTMLTCCDDIQFEDEKNSLNPLIMYNSKRNMIVAGLQGVNNRDNGKSYEILRNLFANSLNICAGKRLKNSETYNYIRREKINYLNKKQSNIDMMLIITYIIWLAAIILTILRIMKNWRYLGAKI